MREWEEFEREWFEQEEAHKVVERQHRAEKKVCCFGTQKGRRACCSPPLLARFDRHTFSLFQRSQMADRAERQAAERQRLANAVLEEDEETFEARSSSWASFLQGKGKAKRRKQGGGSMKVVKARREDRGLGTGV